MNIIDVQTKIQNLTKAKVSLSQIGEVLGISRAAMSKRAKLGSDIGVDELKTIEKFYNLSLFDVPSKNDNSEHVTLDYFPDVFGSCGNGVFQFSMQKETLTIPKNAFFTKYSPAKTYFIINAYGNSMQPFIYDKDKLIVESYDGEQIIDNRPYVFSYKDEIFIKRLAKNVNQLVIIPDNKDYDVIKLSGADLQDVDIIGQIVGLMRDLR